MTSSPSTGKRIFGWFHRRTGLDSFLRETLD